MQEKDRTLPFPRKVAVYPEGGEINPASATRAATTSDAELSALRIAALLKKAVNSPAVAFHQHTRGGRASLNSWRVPRWPAAEGRLRGPRRIIICIYILF